MTSRCSTRLFYFTTMAFASCLLASCVTELGKPFLATDNSAIDSNLLGKWKGRPEEETVFEFVKGAPMTNSLKLISNDGEFRIYCREFVGMNLMQFTEVKDGNESHRLLAYEVTGDQLFLYLLNNDILKKAVRGGELKGTITPRGSGPFSSGEDVVITDEPKQLEAWLKKRGKSAFYPERLHYATRVK